MSQKLQELTNKLYQEGIEKARSEAKTILAEAEQKRQEITDNAAKEAQKIIDNGKKEAEQLVSQGKADLGMASEQAIAALKQKISGLLAAQTLSENIRSALQGKEFIKTLILDLIKKWNSEKQSMELILSKEMEKEFSAYLNRELKSSLDKGLEIKFEGRMQGGFQIRAKDGSYMLSFTDHDFEEFFQSFVREKIRSILFGK